MPFCALRLVFFAVKIFTTRFDGGHEGLRGLGGLISGKMILGHNDSPFVAFHPFVAI
jgi:hypothetical protein